MLDTLSYQVELSVSYEQAVETDTEALKQEGFGVLTDVDIRATLKEKLDVDFRRYTILGACNPPLAHQALQNEPLVGLLLPCNVTVEETEDGVLISLVNPEAMLAVGDLAQNEKIGKVAEEARARLERVSASLAQRGRIAA
ncbi:MAG: DUF302 domain-containing protein [Anaerolineales bacterium]